MAANPLSTKCEECGGVLPPAGACVDDFHRLLALEAQVTGAAGAEPHFLAVATYNLQHPSGFVPAALVGLHETVTDVLTGRATVADALGRARRATDGPTQVRRRTDTLLSDADRRLLSSWPRRWAMTVQDVSSVTPEQYVSQVRAWAQCVTDALHAVFAPLASSPTPASAPDSIVARKAPSATADSPGQPSPRRSTERSH